MKTHAVKENRILKSVDFVIIVVTMSFVSFVILKSMVPFPDWTNHSGSGVSQKVEFPVLEQKAIPVNNGSAVQENTMIHVDPAANVFNKGESEKTVIKPSSVESNAGTAIKGGVKSDAAKADQPVENAAKTKNTENAPVVGTQSEKSMLENWIKDRDEWEQK
jgi:hypothetical protein